MIKTQSGSALHAARRYFDVHGYIAHDHATALRALGYDVQRLERRWASGRDDD